MFMFKHLIFINFISFYLPYFTNIWLSKSISISKKRFLSKKSLSIMVSINQYLSTPLFIGLVSLFSYWLPLVSLVLAHLRQQLIKRTKELAFWSLISISFPPRSSVTLFRKLPLPNARWRAKGTQLTNEWKILMSKNLNAWHFCNSRNLSHPKDLLTNAWCKGRRVLGNL